MLVRIFSKISRFSIAVGSLSGLATALMMVVIIVDVVGRAFFASPLPLATEISVMLLVTKIFMGMAGAQATASNFCVTIITDMLPPRMLRIQELFYLAISIAGISVIAWLTSVYAVQSFEQGESSFGIHIWWLWPERVILAIGFWLLLIQMLSDFFAILLGLKDALKATLPDHTGAL